MAQDSERQRSSFVTAALAGTRFTRVEWVSETGSTNEDLLRVAQQGGTDQALVADLQTAGRGRRDRVWNAPTESSVLMSVLVRGSVRGAEARSPFWTIGAVALAAAQAITDRIEGECQMKWPNDLMIDGYKVAGVLAQLVDDAVIVGTGINVNWPGERPEGVPEHATAVSRHTPDGAIDRQEFVVDMLRAADHNLGLSGEELRQQWVANCATIGIQVRAELDGDELIGQAVDVAADGALIIERDGELVPVQVGDVVHLRPT